MFATKKEMEREVISQNTLTYNEPNTILGSEVMIAIQDGVPTMTIPSDKTKDGAIQIDGNFHGNIFLPCQLIIGEQGTVVGNIFTNSLIVAGRIEGKVFVKETINLLKTGVVVGDIKATSMLMEVGAVIDGNYHIDPTITEAAPSNNAPETKTIPTKKGKENKKSDDDEPVVEVIEPGRGVPFDL